MTHYKYNTKENTQMTTSTEPTAFDTRTMFNKTICNILNGEVNNLCYIEFIELCIFYQKMNAHNTNILKMLSDVVCAKHHFAGDLNNTLNGLEWDSEDECFYRFMTSFTNL
jgi:hypothetical protein